MMDHVSIGVKDIARSRAFYDAALSPLGYHLLSDGETSLGYGGDAARFWVQVSKHPVPDNDTSGLHFCLIAPNRHAVDAFHAAALEKGGVDNGQPGLRDIYGPNYYAAFVKDPDGYRIEAWCGDAPATS